MQKRLINSLKVYFIYALVVFVLMIVLKQIISYSFPVLPSINQINSITTEQLIQEIKKQEHINEHLNFVRAVENTHFDFSNYLFSQLTYSLKEENKKVIFYGRIPLCDDNKTVYRGANLVYNFNEKKPEYLELLGSKINLSCDIPTALERAGLSKDEVKSKCLIFYPQPAWKFAVVNKTFLVDLNSCNISTKNRATSL